MKKKSTKKIAKKATVKVDKDSGMLCLTLKPGGIVSIGDDILILLERISKRQCRIIFKVPKTKKITRHYPLET